MTLASWMPWKRNKPAADPMQADTQTDPRTEDALDAVARKYKNRAELWQRVSLNGDKLRVQAVLERDLARRERDAAYAKLREINGMVTPGCAGIGRKMARAAREGLPEYAAGEREAA